MSFYFHPLEGDESQCQDTHIADTFLHNASNYTKYMPHFSSHFKLMQTHVNTRPNLNYDLCEFLAFSFYCYMLDYVIWDFQQHDRKHEICFFN